MRSGGSKGKGASFEREVCTKLSLWVTNGDKRDCFWRSAMSGGRSTIAARKGQDLRRQAGDICAVAPEGHVLTDRWYIECKHVKDLNLVKFFLAGTGTLAQFWQKACEEAARYSKSPVIIARQNHLPIIFVSHWTQAQTLAEATRWVDHAANPVSVQLFEDVLAVPFDASPQRPKPALKRYVRQIPTPNLII